MLHLQRCLIHMIRSEPVDPLKDDILTRVWAEIEICGIFVGKLIFMT